MRQRNTINTIKIININSTVSGMCDSVCIRCQPPFCHALLTPLVLYVLTRFTHLRSVGDERQALRLRGEAPLHLNGHS